MDLRDSKSRLILIVVALGAALVIAVASCGGSDDEGPNGSVAESSEGRDGSGGTGAEDSDGKGAGGVEEAGEILAEVKGEDNITLAITRAEREAGGFLTVEGTVHNGSGREWGTVAWAGAERELAGNSFSMAGATLTAKTEGKRYLILRDTEGRCLCTGFGLSIGSGETVNWFAQFPEPDVATTEVDFQIGQMPPVTITIR